MLKVGRYVGKEHLEIDIEELGNLFPKSKNRISISTQCNVFAQSEIITYLSHSKLIENIAADMHYSLAKRLIQMGKAANIRFKKDTVFSGCVARNTGMVKATEDLLGEEVIIRDDFQSMAAL